jgi:DNA helicase-2/ATP-dependent DNA helicase PcrA
MSIEIPKLTGDALAARNSDAQHIQIIAGAGSGKTETISQRVARLVHEGVDPAKIVAFTFTVKAAEELRERIRLRVEKLAGQEKADKLGSLYVGTIHGYCLQLLQTNIGLYEQYDMIDENQLAAFAMRWNSRLDLGQFDPIAGKTRQFYGMKAFLDNLAVVENEMLNLDDLPENFAEKVLDFYELLDQHRLMTFGMQIDRAVVELEKPEVRELISTKIEHLIVDEYQDINPSQERLIQLLSKPIGSANLVVVGDDDQAIYQWRGSSVKNITNFAERYPDVTKFELLLNRRSRPAVVHLANEFAKSIPNRIEKSMSADREANGPGIDIIADHEDEKAEAFDIANAIARLHSKGYSYSQIAILVRTSGAYSRILEALETLNIPVAPGGRIGLFEQPDADFLARVFAWLVDRDWKQTRYGNSEGAVELKDIKKLFETLYLGDWAPVEKLLEKEKAKVGSQSRDVSLVGFCYELLEALEVKEWDTGFVLFGNRLGTIARFVKLVGDYESMRKHARVNEDGTQTGAGDTGAWYYKDLVSLMSNYAIDKYDDFEGEKEFGLDAVDLLTIHTAKGLEWPIVFIPSLTKNRFPSNKTGSKKNWIVPRELFDAERYEGTDADERRLFYVAVTRAREWVSLSAHEKVNKATVKVSPYIVEAEAIQNDKDFPATPDQSDQVTDIDELLQVSYSELADFLSCGWSYWLKSRIGFPAAVVETIGYGKAVHHLMRTIAEETSKRGRPLGPTDVDRILATDFFLPYANSVIAARYKNAARKLAFGYLNEYGEEMNRVWETERPFELAVDGALISGRADVILDKHEGKADSLAIVDYKTDAEGQEFSLQLQIYAEAGAREGLDIRGAYVHDLGSKERQEVDTSVEARQAAINTVTIAVESIKKREFEAKPETSKCGRCDVRAICRAAAKK